MKKNNEAVETKNIDPAFWKDSLPIVFVILWSTGFIGSKLGAPYSEPFTFLALRFSMAAALMISIGIWLGVAWPNTPQRIIHSIVVGILIHGVYLGGVFWSIDNGLSAGITALIISLQPLVTSLAAGPLLRENVSSRNWLGLIIGFAGVTLVINETLVIKLDLSEGFGSGIIPCLISMFALTVGTLYQKKFSKNESLWGQQAIQLSAAAIVLGGLSFKFETQELAWTFEFIITLAWLTIVMSVGTFTLLYVLIERGKASQISSLFYLVPMTTAIMSYFLFNETLSALALVGMGITITAVALATRQN